MVDQLFQLFDTINAQIANGLEVSYGPRPAQVGGRAGACQCASVYYAVTRYAQNWTHAAMQVDESQLPAIFVESDWSTVKRQGNEECVAPPPPLPLPPPPLEWRLPVLARCLVSNGCALCCRV